MWLLDTTTGKMHYIADPSRENYAILSHVWITGKEQTFQDLQRLHNLTLREVWANRVRRLTGRPARPALSKASEKIRECCAFAKARGYRWLWVDTCCIDKTSSAELSEAINSMYQWYAQAGVCYAFLHDVDDGADPRAPGSQFRQSRWFRRGWTLQELIAPRELVFISSRWRPFGTKTSLADVVEEITGVERAVLEHKRPLSAVSVARRMAWAARRKTTRVEDEAYSLMGIFGVNIPTIYGEGRNAFYRLQEEILRRTPDQSIFAWGPLVCARHRWQSEQFRMAPLEDQPYSEDASNGYFFAPSPRAFEDSASIEPLALSDFQRELARDVAVPDYAVTSYGIRTHLPLVPLWRPVPLAPGQPQVTLHAAVLACADKEDGLIVLLLRAPLDQNHGQYKVGCRYPAGFVRGTTLRCLREVLGLSLTGPAFQPPGTSGAPLRVGPEMTMVYIPYRPLELPVESYANRQARQLPYTGEQLDGTPRHTSFTCPCEIVLPQWTMAHLHKAGYTVHTPSGEGNVVHVSEKDSMLEVVLSRGSESIHIGLGPCPILHGWLSRYLTALVSFGSPVMSPVGPAEPLRSSFRPPPPMPESCNTTHVEKWREGCAEFSGEGGTRMRLTFESWTDYMNSGNGRGLYALQVELLEDRDGHGIH